jgi:hypothetical protein
LLAAEDPGVPNLFATPLARFDHHAYTAMLDPHPERFTGVNYVRFYLAGFVAHIKVDHRMPPAPLADFILRDGKPLIVVRRDNLTSKDAAVMRDIARRALKLRRRNPL